MVRRTHIFQNDFNSNPNPTYSFSFVRFSNSLQFLFRTFIICYKMSKYTQKQQKRKEKSFISVYYNTESYNWSNFVFEILLVSAWNALHTRTLVHTHTTTDEEWNWSMDGTKRKTVVRNRRLKHAIVNISFPYTFITMYPISMAQGFLCSFVIVIPCCACNSMTEKEQQSRNEQCNYSIEVDIDMNTKLDNRNAISIWNKQQNTRMTVERNEARKKIGAIFCVAVLYSSSTSI